MKKFLILLIAILTCRSILNAGTAASFLRLGADARGLGLGTAYTSVVSDANSLYWNPSGLARVKKPEAAATYGALYSDLQYNLLAYAHPVRAGTLGLSALYLRQDNLEGRSESREKTAGFSASDFAFTFGLGRRVSPSFGLGFSGKWIQSQIAGASAGAFAVDAGAQVLFSKSNLQAGFAILNLGQGMKFQDKEDPLPLTLSAGLNYTGLKFILLSAEVRQEVHDSRTLLSVGSEFSPMPWASLRAGYLSHEATLTNSFGKSEGDKFASLAGLGLGAGLKIGLGRLDYSINPAGELGSAHRISLTLAF